MTAGLAFEAAADDIRMGRSKVALALGVNFETATPAAEHMMSSMRTTGDVDFHVPSGFTPISWYAMDAARYIYEFRSSREELATVAVKNRKHASMNPLAQFRKPITLADVLAQAPIVEPLGLYEVPPRSDGAVCLVLAAEDVARDTGRPYARLRGRGFFHEGAHQINEVPNDMIALVAAQTAGRTAMTEAGIDPERSRLCRALRALHHRGGPWSARPSVSFHAGKAVAFARTVRRLLAAVSRSAHRAGLQSRGHPAYVTPFYSFVEALEQLRGRAGERQVKDARLGLTIAELGNYNAALVHVLEAVR